jgi:hypothetical protein
MRNDDLQLAYEDIERSDGFVAGVKRAVSRLLQRAWNSDARNPEEMLFDIEREARRQIDLAEHAREAPLQRAEALEAIEALLRSPETQPKAGGFCGIGGPALPAGLEGLLSRSGTHVVKPEGSSR